MMAGRPMYTFLATGLLIAMAYGQDYPFSDDFSNPVQTNLKWGKWYPTDPAVSGTCANGVYTINNSSSQTYPEIYHNFTTKTSTFTASCVVTRSSATIAAGMWLCLDTFPTPSGYAVELLGDNGNDCIGYVAIYKYDTDSTIFDAEYHRQGLSDTLKVSKQGSTFNVFCNGVYLGTCSDNTPAAPGNFALMVPAHSAADFDDVLFTNQFTQGSFPVAFVDNFNNGRIEKQWILMGCSNFSEHDTVLDITAPPGPVTSGVFCEVPMTVDTFYSRLVVSHRSGDSNSFYGFYLRGSNPSQIAFFGISGLRAGGAYLPSGSAVPYFPPSIIHGKEFVNGNDTTFYQDTIVVMKTNGSNNFIMYVNGHNIDTLTTADINFQIVRAGIFATEGGGQNIFADYFYLGPDSGGTGVVNISPRVRTLKIARFSPMTSRYLFNPLGRIVGRKNAYGRMSGKVFAPGFYITDEKKSGIIINKLAQ
jgi:hypothetical protein